MKKTVTLILLLQCSVWAGAQHQTQSNKTDSKYFLNPVLPAITPTQVSFMTVIPIAWCIRRSSITYAPQRPQRVSGLKDRIVIHWKRRRDI